MQQDRNHAPERHAKRCIPDRSEAKLANLRQARLGALSKNVDSHASNHDIGVESSQQNHCVGEIPSRLLKKLHFACLILV